MPEPQLEEMTSAERLAMDERMSTNYAEVSPIVAAYNAKRFREEFGVGETDPTGRSPHSAGAKLDAGKVPVLRGTIQQFPRALEHVARVSLHGAEKYTWNGWEQVPDGFQRYTDAMGRHLVKEQTEGAFDADSGELHAAQVAWNALARLELMLRAKEGL